MLTTTSSIGASASTVARGEGSLPVVDPDGVGGAGLEVGAQGHEVGLGPIDLRAHDVAGDDLVDDRDRDRRSRPLRLNPVERVAGVGQTRRDFQEVLRRVGLGDVDGYVFDRRGDFRRFRSRRLDHVRRRRWRGRCRGRRRRLFAASQGEEHQCGKEAEGEEAASHSDLLVEPFTCKTPLGTRRLFPARRSIGKAPKRFSLAAVSADLYRELRGPSAYLVFRTGIPVSVSFPVSATW